jgi:aspartyl-tRNA(Asn)/glutamyl-tRNA(Gln) amidotransferase subunit A
VPVPDYSDGLEKDIKSLKIGVPRALFGEGLDDEVRNAVEQSIENYRSMGAEIVDVELPLVKYGIAVYYIIATAEASSNLARFDGVRYGFRAEEAGGLREMYFKTREEGFGEEVKRRIMLGTYVLSSGYYDAYYAKAQKVRTLLKNDFQTAFAKCDAIITPTSPTVAFKIGEKSDDPLAMYLNDVYTVSANLAGIPGISVPCGLSSEGLPIGLQLLGNNWSESLLLNLSHVYEKSFPLNAKPKIFAE